jgi:tetratricopeptide (TPR) repeat protein
MITSEHNQTKNSSVVPIDENFNIVNNYINSNNLDKAVEYAQTWQAKQENNPMPCTFLAHIYAKVGQLDVALKFCNQALNLDKFFYSAMIEKARILSKYNKPILACHIYLETYQSHPKIIEYFKDWATNLLNIQDYSTLQQITEIAIQTQQFINDADMYFYHGLSLQYQNNYALAIPSYEKAYHLNPDMPMLLNNLAASYKENGCLNKAKELLELAIKQSPENNFAWCNYGSVLHKMDLLEDAHQVYNQSIKLDPQYPITYNNLGLLLREKQDIKGAEQALEAAVKLDPNYDSAKWNLAMIKLVQGNYAEGWPLHEYRWNGSGELRGKPHGLPQPEWDGTQNISGKRMLVWGEQGFGDALQFCRYLPLFQEKIKKMGGELIYCCFSALQDLFDNSFAHLFNDSIINDKQRPLPDFDYHVPLLKLPLLFNTTLESIPNNVPYVQPSGAAVQKYKHFLGQDSDLKVGLIWTGSPIHQRNPFRSVGLNNYVRFKDIEGASFYGLQFNAQNDIEEAHKQGFMIQDLTNNIENFDESAAIIKQLDLVITTCTSTAHLAGALGVNTWLLLDVNPHWVWLLDRSDSPWYPKTKLYRQTEYKNWESVMQRVYADLSTWTQAVKNKSDATTKSKKTATTTNKNSVQKTITSTKIDKTANKTIAKVDKVDKKSLDMEVAKQSKTKATQKNDVNA